MPILIVEDDADIRESLAMLLDGEGYRVFSAANGRAGLDLLPKMPRPCVILLDLMMPVMDGWQFAHALETFDGYADVPVVLVTAYSNETRGIRHAGIIKKPVDVDALLACVARHC